MEEEQQVEFQCLTAGWFPQPDVGWSLNGAPVNSSLFNSSSTPVGDTFTSTSVLTFQALASTTVECWASVAALSNPQASWVFLDVGTERTGRAETSNTHTHTHFEGGFLCLSWSRSQASGLDGSDRRGRVHRWFRSADFTHLRNRLLLQTQERKR